MTEQVKPWTQILGEEALWLGPSAPDAQAWDLHAPKGLRAVISGVGVKGRGLSREHPSWSVFTPGTTPALQPSGQKKHPSGYQRHGSNVCVPPTTSVC